jgi:hypothetical protein
MFQPGKCYEHRNPATSTFIKVIDASETSEEYKLIVSFITKAGHTLIASDEEIHVKKADIDNWKQKPS